MHIQTHNIQQAGSNINTLKVSPHSAAHRLQTDIQHEEREPLHTRTTHSPDHPARNAGVRVHTGGKSVSAISEREENKIA